MSSKELRLEKSNYIKSRKCVPCADCGVAYPDYVMDFHHIDEDNKDLQLKRRGGSSMVNKMAKWSFGRIDEEIYKCVVLCANCHRIRHHS